jgi:hypothetical protein
MRLGASVAGRESWSISRLSREIAASGAFPPISLDRVDWVFTESPSGKHTECSVFSTTGFADGIRQGASMERAPEVRMSRFLLALQTEGFSDQGRVVARED